MKLTSKIRKMSVVALVGAVLFASASTLSVHAQTIAQVSVSRPGYGITSTDDGYGVNVRNAPNLGAGIIVSIPNNSPVMIVGEDGDFYVVQYDTDGHYGYMAKDYLNFQQKSFYLVVNTASDPLNLRAMPSETSTSLARIPHNGAFAYYNYYNSNDWYHGVYGNATGYTSRDYTLLEGY